MDSRTVLSVQVEFTLLLLWLLWLAAENGRVLEVMDWVGEISAVTVSSDQRELGPVLVLDRCGVVVEFEVVVGELLDEVEVRTRTV